MLKASCALSILLAFSLTESLIFPIQFSKYERCAQSSVFKNVDCIYIGFSLETMAIIATANNPKVKAHLVNLSLDTGSPHTWLVTNNTKFLKTDGSNRLWDEVFDPTLQVLNYRPKENDNVGKTINPEYVDRSSLLLTAYKNQEFELLPTTSGEKIRVPMDVYFAEEYRIDRSNITKQGILALALRREPEDFNNMFLYKFLEAYPKKYKPMMSFDINWNRGYEKTSCFGLGEPLPISNHLHRPTVKLDSFSDHWIVPVSYIHLKFFTGKTIIIQPHSEYIEKDTMVYLNTTGVSGFIGLVDSGSSVLGLPSSFFQNLSRSEVINLNAATSKDFYCDLYTQVLPIISIGLQDGNYKSKINIYPSKLFRRKISNPTECTSLLMILELKADYNFIFGLPFFVSTYIEMIWFDTRKISNWDNMDFNAKVEITGK